MSGVPQGSVLEPVLFNIFLGNMDSGTECTLSKFADDTKLGGAVHALEGRDAIQRDLDRLERLNFMSFVRAHKTKRKVLHIGHGNPNHKYRQGREWIESSPEEKGLGVQRDEKLAMTQQCVLAAQQDSRALGCIPSSVGTGRGGDFAPLPHSAETPRESCVQLWSPQHRTELELWERGQRRPQQ